MAIQYAANFGAALDASDITPTSVADLGSQVTVIFNEGVSKSQQVFALEYLQDFIASNGAEGGPVFPEVNFSAAAQAISEEGAVATVTVTLDVPSIFPVSVAYVITGTAVVDDDYTCTASPLVIPAGASSASFEVTAVPDDVADGDVTVILTLDTITNGVAGSTDVHTVTITDAGALPTVDFTTDAQVSVGETGVLVVTAQLDAAFVRDVTVPLVVTGTAEEDVNYTISAASISIPAGDTTGSVTLTLIPDEVAAGDLTVILTMDTPVNADAGATDVHTATITDVD